MTKITIIISLLFTCLIYVWKSLRYFSSSGELNWGHGRAGDGVLYLLVLLTLFFIAFKFQSIRIAVLTYITTLIFMLIISGIGLLLYFSSGCPTPRLIEFYQKNPEYKSDTSNYHAELYNAISRGTCQDILRVKPDLLYTSTLSPETYSAFIGSLAYDIRVPFTAFITLIVLVLPAAFMGKVLGKVFARTRGDKRVGL